jgi:hypothetical protein
LLLSSYHTGPPPGCKCVGSNHVCGCPDGFCLMKFCGCDASHGHLMFSAKASPQAPPWYISRILLLRAPLHGWFLWLIHDVGFGLQELQRLCSMLYMTCYQQDLQFSVPSSQRRIVNLGDVWDFAGGTPWFCTGGGGIEIFTPIRPLGMRTCHVYMCGTRITQKVSSQILVGLL